MATVERFQKDWSNVGTQDRQEMLRDDVLAGTSVSLLLISVIAAGTLAMALVTAYIIMTS